VSERLFPTVTGDQLFAVREHKNNGRVYLLGSKKAGALSDALANCGLVFDMEIPNVTVQNGQFTYIHKKVEGKDIYFFANSADNNVAAEIRVRGQKDLEAWDPLTGLKQPVEYLFENGCTKLRINLSPVQSMFYVSKY